MKRCSKCKEEKPIECFYVKRSEKDGHDFECSACVKARRREYGKISLSKRRVYDEKNRQRINVRQRLWREENPDKLEAYRKAHRRLLREKKGQYYAVDLKRNYGLTPDDIIRMRVDQEDRCACCGKKKVLVIDHCHRRNQVRALVCHQCNCLFGFAHDTPGLLEAAARYLRKHAAPVRAQGGLFADFTKEDYRKLQDLRKTWNK